MSLAFNITNEAFEPMVTLTYSNEGILSGAKRKREGRLLQSAKGLQPWAGMQLIACNVCGVMTRFGADDDKGIRNVTVEDVTARLQVASGEADRPCNEPEWSDHITGPGGAFEVEYTFASVINTCNVCNGNTKNKNDMTGNRERARIACTIVAAINGSNKVKEGGTLPNGSRKYPIAADGIIVASVANLTQYVRENLPLSQVVAPATEWVLG